MTAIMTNNFDTDFCTIQPVHTDLSQTTGGLLVGTKVATSFGWRPVQAIAEGDLVLTFDNGLQRVTRVQTHVLDMPRQTVTESAWPLHVPANALGNLAPLIVMPGQSVLVESDLAEELLGDAFVAIQATQLNGVEGIERVIPAERLTVITLHFEQDEVIFGAGGVLFVCEGRGDLVQDLHQSAPIYPTLPADLARMIVHDGVLPAGSMSELAQATERAA
ncbi:Hint domain-containing protein [Flavimaricola marinus]|uniref:Hedgehog/Intein (Hint) domain-containing protein n=1 Tax=Flavimaricola marinus TaxID=1819565 RepID=A0A238LM69_9RHOB|nr:Hint domain-containing protein [Flavimaricola marinus]SMY09940.1 hypothetical protein LOM8899_04113 [Flavimaricola marinus]